MYTQKKLVYKEERNLKNDMSFITCIDILYTSIKGAIALAIQNEPDRIAHNFFF